MNRSTLDNIIASLYGNENFHTEISNCSASRMLDAFDYLDKGGFTPDQVQWLLGRRLSQFAERHFGEVMALMLAVKNGYVMVANLHQILRNEQLHAKIYGQSKLFDTDPLPDRQSVDSELGIIGANTPNHVKSPASQATVTFLFGASDNAEADMFF